MSFLFNKEGRVIQNPGDGMASCIRQNAPGHYAWLQYDQVLSRYGWSNDGAHDGENVIMRYGGADRVAFQMVRNRVLESRSR